MYHVYQNYKINCFVDRVLPNLCLCPFRNMDPNDYVFALTDKHHNNFVGDDGNENLILDEDEVYAWKELRLHPLLVKSIRQLGFKEPTPIQKACIPAAAHQGKVGFFRISFVTFN